MERGYVPPPARGVDVSSLVRALQAERLSEVVSIPLSEMHHAYVLAWHCTVRSHPELVIRGSSAEKLNSAPLPDRAEVVALDGEQTSVRLELHDGRWETVERMRTLAQSLGQHHADDVEHMELCCAKPGTGSAGTLRFGGKVAGGIWHIDETFPALSVENLRSALNLVRDAEEGTVLRLDDADAIARAFALFKEEWGPLFTESMPQLEGNTVTLSNTDASELHLLSTYYLRLVFGDEFPVEPIDSDLLVKVDRVRQKEAFASQVIYQGAGRQFVSTCVSLMDEEAVEDCADTDETMQEMGAQLIGDLTCSAFGGFVFRYYALPDGHSRLVWMRREGGFFPTMIQIISDFNDGATLLTSTSSVKEDEPGKKIYRLGYPAGSLPELYEKHIERCEELGKIHEGFKALEPSLLECAQRFDESMSRQS